MQALSKVLPQTQLYMISRDRFSPQWVISRDLVLPQNPGEMAIYLTHAALLILREMIVFIETKNKQFHIYCLLKIKYFQGPLIWHHKYVIFQGFSRT